MIDFLSEIAGARNAPLACTVRATRVVDSAMPFVWMFDACYAGEAGSLEEELINRAPHGCQLLKEGNSTPCCIVEDATQSMECSTSIEPF